jgi:hypothetical protein
VLILVGDICNFGVERLAEGRLGTRNSCTELALNGIESCLSRRVDLVFNQGSKLFLDLIEVFYNQVPQLLGVSVELL